MKKTTTTGTGEGWRGGMKRTMTKILCATMTAMLLASCSEITRQSAPVQMIVSNTQKLTRIDISPNAANCDQSIADVDVRTIALQTNGGGNLPVDTRFQDVRLTSYRVSYVRRDGGTLVPAPFTRTTSGLVTPGGSGTKLTQFLAFQTGALNQAPFAALLPSGGGRDPQTGRNVVTMDAILEVFGETLAGERVSGSTRITLDFCYSCGGCA